jgi:hypothetical protein
LSEATLVFDRAAGIRLIDQPALVQLVDGDVFAVLVSAVLLSIRLPDI